jgi:hypothetical protein
MAYNVTKNYVCSTRKEFLQKIYDVLNAGDANWSIIHEEGGYDSGSPSDGDYFVIECTTDWDDAAVAQQLVLCANDGSSHLTFGGVGGADWPVEDDDWSFVYSPDGGWNASTKNFSDRVGSLTEKNIMWGPSSSSIPGIVGSFVSAPDAFIIHMTCDSNILLLYAGKITSLDSAADDPRPCHFFWGRGDLSRGNAQCWGYYLATTSCQGFVPNAARDDWEYSFVTYEYYEALDTHTMTKNGSKWVELPMVVYDSSTLRVAGAIEHVRRVATSLTYGMESNDGTRVAYDGISLPWGN